MSSIEPYNKVGNQANLATALSTLKEYKHVLITLSYYANTFFTLKSHRTNVFSSPL